MMGIRRFGRLTVETSHEDKVLFPGKEITKGDLIDYYAEIAPVMLSHLRGRPLTLERIPDGLDGDRFYQKEVPDHFPDWIDRVEIPLKQGGSQRQVLAGNAATLAYLANQGTVTPHAWVSRQGKLDRPDRVVLDLDPTEDGSGGDFEPVMRAARAVRDLWEEVGLVPFVMTTGSRGLHVLAPIRTETGFEDARDFARSSAELLAVRDPERLTTRQRKAKRGGRLFLDTTRNAYGQTTVAPYALRARPEAPVATPVDWDELGTGMHSRRYTLGNIFRRLAGKEDPWRSMSRNARSLDRPRNRLLKLVDREPGRHRS